MPLSPNLDTAGFLTRDPFLWHEAAKTLYETNITSDFMSFPKTILASGFPTTATSEAETILLDFLASLQSFLGATNTTALDYDALWAATGPEAATSSLDDFLTRVYPTLIGQQQYNLFTLPFYADYAAAHHGRRPFIGPVPLIRWAFTEGEGPEAPTQALNNKTIFMEWWETVMPPSEESCSETLLVYIGSEGTPTYRNVYRRYEKLH